MKTSLPIRLAKSLTLAVALGLTLTGGLLRAAEQNDAVLLGRLKDSKLSLAAGIAQSEKENGIAISEKAKRGHALLFTLYACGAYLGK